MDLVLDIGNTRVKAGLFSGERLLLAAAMPPGDTAAMEAFAARAPVERAVYGTVAGDHPPVLDALRKRLPVERIRPEGPLPIRTAYREPGTLGIDRLANAAAVAARFPGRAALAIGLGTCIVHDLVDAGGLHRGGSISPGLRMRAAAMHRYSAALPLVEPAAEAPLWADSTTGSLQAGIWNGVMGELERAIAAARAEHPGLAVVLTGGDALAPARALKSGIFAHPSLTLEGLLRIYRHRAGLAGGLPGRGPGAAG